MRALSNGDHGGSGGAGGSGADAPRAAWYPVGPAGQWRSRDAIVELHGLKAKIGDIPGDGEVSDRGGNGRGLALRTGNGLLWACLAECEDSALPPAEIDGFRARDMVAVNTVTVRTDFDQVVLGLVDPAHVPMVHNSWWWRSTRRRKEKTKSNCPCPFGFVAKAVDARKSSPVYGMLGGDGEVTIEFRLPCLRIERLTGRKNRVVNFTFVTPLRPGVQRLQNIIFTDLNWLKPLSPVLRSFGQTFLEQDARILNMLAKSGRPADKMLFCGDPDLPSLWYFRLKREFETSCAQQRTFRNPVPERMLKWRT